MKSPSLQLPEWCLLLAALTTASAPNALAGEEPPAPQKLSVQQVIELLPECAAADQFDRGIRAIGFVENLNGLTRERQMDLAVGLSKLESSMLRAGQVEKAILVAQKARQLFPTEMRTGLNLGGILVTASRYKDAIPVLNEAMTQRPDLYPVEDVDKVAGYTNLGKALLLTGKAQDATQPLFKAIALGPTHAAALYLLGQAYVQLDQPQNALRNLERAYELKPDDAEPHDLVNLVDLLYDQGRYDKVVRVASQGCKRLPVAQGLRFYWALCLIKADHRADAYFMLQHELLVGGEKSKYSEPAGRKLRELSDQARANPKEKQNHLIVLCVAGLQSMPANYDKAIEYFERAIKESGQENAILELFIGEACAGLKRYPDAIKHFQKATEVDPGLAAAYIELGDMLLKDGKPLEADRAWRTAILLDPENWKVKQLIEKAHRQAEKNKPTKDQK